MEFLTNLWNNEPNVVIGVGIATPVLLGMYVFLLDITKKNVATSSITDFYLHLSILLVEMQKKYYR